MKTLLAALALFCLTFAARAQDWPRNPKTGKVEFTGLLPWPAAAKTEAQRRELVRVWYVARLTDALPETIQEQQRSNKTNGLLTYAGLPKVAMMGVGKGEQERSVTYLADLTPTPKGLQYRLYFFSTPTGANSAPEPLEPQLAAMPENEQAALAVLRGRLVAAVKGWR